MLVTINGVETVVEVAKAPPMTCCYVGIVDNTPIIRSGYIDDLQQVSALIKLGDSLKKDEEVIVCLNQINTTQTEWDWIDKQHQSLSDVPCLHLLSSLGPLYLKESPRRPVASERRAFEEMQRLINAEAWVTYCSRYNTLLEKAFSTFKYDAVDAYTIERYIMEYHHEVKSHYLARTKDRLKELIHRKKSSDDNTLIKLEKEIIIQQKSLLNQILAHYNHLAEIVRLIPIIEKSHPELIAAWRCGSLLKRLLDFEVGTKDAKPLEFDHQQVLLQLLNEELGILSALNSFDGFERTNLAFSLRLAMMQLKKVISKEKAIDFALNFEQSKAKIYQAIVSEGAGSAQIEKWRANDEGVNYLFLFWEFFLEDLLKICEPMARKIREEKVKKTPYLNPEYLDIIPPVVNSDLLLTLDNQTRKPQELTEHGRQFLDLLW